MTNAEKKMPELRMVRATVCLLAITAFAAPSVAEAQIGGLIKRKAAEKVAKKVDEALGKQDSTPPQAGAGARGPDGRRREPLQPVNETIDASTLDALLAGLNAMTVKLRQADSLHRVVASNGGVDSVALRDAGRYATDLEQKRPCFDMAFEQVDYQRLQEASRIAHAPSASVERMRAYEEAQIAMDQRRNNMSNPLSAEERRRLVREFLLEHANMRVNPAADSVTVARECGPAPRISEAGRRAAQNDTLVMRARVLEQEAGEAGVRVSGLPEHRFFVLRERLYLWMKQREAIQWSAAESGLLEIRRADLERVRRGILGAEAAGT